MHSNVVATASISRDANVLWRCIGSFGSVGEWHPMIQQLESEGDGEGAERIAHTAFGETQVERLKVSRPDQRFYRYEMVSTSLPLDNYVGELRVMDRGDGRSFVRWSASFDVETEEARTLTEQVEDFLNSGLDNLKEQYG